MTYNFDAIKIPTFTGINDSPVEPTATKAGNGSHLIKQYNDLVTAIQAALNQLATNNTTWIQVDTNYSASLGEKIIAVSNDNSIDIILPTTDRSDNPSITLLKTSANNSVRILLGSSKFKGETINDEIANISTECEEVTLIYCGANLGWIPTKENAIIISPISET